MPNIDDFILRWQESGAAERANFPSFAAELCDHLEVPRPDPTRPDETVNAYVFERNVTFHHADGHTSSGRIDLYKRGCFVLEAKQGSSSAAETPLFGAVTTPGRRGTARRGTRSWDDAMMKARAQAERYARALPASEGRPPFLVVVDVGHTIELYSEFSRTGGSYVPFPDPQSHRITLTDLRDEQQRETLRAVWTDPLSLDPTRRSARVTREIADKLAKLAKSLEASGHAPEAVAAFLMRAIFTMFAEDVGLLPKDAFRTLLESVRGDTEHFREIVEPLWATMNTGGYSRDLRHTLLRFNGGLFAEPHALPVTEGQLELLIEAAGAAWGDVEPAIFGTLLERALNPRERHKLGAHYTPRAYVERLVMPTVIEPLRGDWEGVQAAAANHLQRGRLKDAVRELETFHHKLCHVRVLDPACGSGNFLYVTLEHLKRLEGEVLDAIRGLSDDERERLDLVGVTVTPEQLLGIEVNPRAAKIAELVLWIGYLQWHFRTKGDTLPQEPVIRDFHNIECRDAVLAFDGVEVVREEAGSPVTRWDGRTTKLHPVTGREVPDETARTEELRYLNPRKATWPEADFVVGNPPFIGSKRMRDVLGDGYVNALQRAWPEVPQATDFVLRWWSQAAALARSGRLRRFGLITTNSVTQSYNRRAIEPHLSASQNPLSLTFAVPDHPWVDTVDGAAVRIAMTVGEQSDREGTLRRVLHERPSNERGGQDLVVELAAKRGIIHADLSVGVNVTAVHPLKANERLCAVGFKTIGDGFIVTREEAQALGLGRRDGLEAHIRPYLNGRDVAGVPRRIMVIDLFGLSENEVRERFPEVYQHLLERVKPERDHNRNAVFRHLWWVIGHPRPILREFTTGLERFISTLETSKHRFFTFIPTHDAPDSTLVTFGLADAYFLGVLSSRIHVVWALATGGTLEDRPRYNKTRCFETFPFPDATDEQKARVRTLAESLDAHRKERLTEYPSLTMTGIYNVLEKLRTEEALRDKEITIHQQGLVSVLKELHDELDEAVLEAYGWPTNLSNEELLEGLVALNTERAAEEAKGLVRWLRPEYQHPEGTAQAVSMGLETVVASLQTAKQVWPKSLPEQAQAVRQVVSTLNQPATSADIARQFRAARADRVGELLETLALLGQVRVVGDQYVI